MRDAGLFVSHLRSARIDRAYLRLVAETAGLVDWHFLHNPPPGARPRTVLDGPDPGTVLPGRYAAMIANGGVQGGYLDVALLPCVLATRAARVWCVEYDVDYAGRWSDFFGPLAADDADLLTSTLARRAAVPDWSHWAWAAAPGWVAPEHHLRAFHPVMRLSRAFAQAYAVMMADAGWAGHYEFTLPTAACASGARVADLGGDGAFVPAGRRGRFYANTPTATRLSPGTLVWRPARPTYFHEDPEGYVPGMLHHPVKADVAVWTWADRNRHPPGS